MAAMPPSRKRRNVPARQSFDTELSRGYSAGLMETRAYWKSITACSAHFEVPEKEINDCLRQSVRFSNLLTEKNPATGKYCKVNGAWNIILNEDSVTRRVLPS